VANRRGEYFHWPLKVNNNPAAQYASGTFVATFLQPMRAEASCNKPGPSYAVEVVSDDEIERRLHDSTLDFGVVAAASLSRPLQLKELGAWRLNLWLPAGLCRNDRAALQALKAKQLPLILPRRELPALALAEEYEPRLACGSFLEARTALAGNNLATLLPDFRTPENETQFRCVRVPGSARRGINFAWLGIHACCGSTRTRFGDGTFCARR
jgi:hypothetical protein